MAAKTRAAREDGLLKLAYMPLYITEEEDVLLEEMGYKTEAGYQQKGGKCDAVEQAKDTDYPEDGRREDGGLLLINELVTHWMAAVEDLPDGRTRGSTMRWIKTKLHDTTKVSMEFEKVWVWYVQVT